MADNSTLPVSGGGTEVFANDDIGSVKYPRVKATWGPDGTANDTDVASGKPMPVQLRVSDGTAFTLGSGAVAAGTLRIVHATDDPAVVLLRTNAYSASATFTPAATSHTAGDCNGAAAEFATIGPSAGRVMITSASLEIDGGTAEATAWTLYLYNITPPSATADDGAWDLASGDRASFLGAVNLGTAVDLISTQWIEAHGINKQIKLAGTSVFAYLVNSTTLTPANVAHIVTLHTVGI